MMLAQYELTYESDSELSPSEPLITHKPGVAVRATPRRPERKIGFPDPKSRQSSDQETIENPIAHSSPRSRVAFRGYMSTVRRGRQMGSMNEWSKTNQSRYAREPVANENKHTYIYISLAIPPSQVPFGGFFIDRRSRQDRGYRRGLRNPGGCPARTRGVEIRRLPTVAESRRSWPRWLGTSAIVKQRGQKSLTRVVE